jgi:hypothetical protein
MNDPLDVTVDSFTESERLGNPEPEEDREEAPYPESGPRHVIRENAPLIDANDLSAARDANADQVQADAKAPDADAAREKWKAELRDAAKRWDRLTEDDIMALGRHSASLTELVRRRYPFSSDTVAEQVTDFIRDHQSFRL